MKSNGRLLDAQDLGHACHMVMFVDQFDNVQLDQVQLVHTPLRSTSSSIDLIYEHQQNSSKKLIPILHTRHTTRESGR